jgi:hypothetical protein
MTLGDKGGTDNSRQPGPHSQFKASLSQILRPYLKKARSEDVFQHLPGMSKTLSMIPISGGKKKTAKRVKQMERK